MCIFDKAKPLAHYSHTNAIFRLNPPLAVFP